MARGRSLRRICEHAALLLLGSLAGVLLVEAALQITAFWVWRHAYWQHSAAPSAVNPRDLRRVLCVGDSFTYGEGASSIDNSYPSQLQRFLDEAHDAGDSSLPPWLVINRGWPGRNSAELLQRIPGLLLRERPDYVVILIGTNTRWAHAEMDLPPPRLTEASSKDDYRRWQWRLRTLRLVQLTSAVLARRASRPQDRPTPRSAPGAPTRGEPAHAGAPSTAGVGAPQPVPTPGGKLYSDLKEVKRLVKEPDVIELTSANHMLDELRPRVRAAGDRAAAELLLELLGKLRRPQDVVDDGMFAIEKYGKSAALCGRMVEPLARLGRLDDAGALAEDAVRLQEPGHEQAWIYRARAIVYLYRHNYPLYLQDSIRAFSIDGDGARLDYALRKVLVRKSPSSLKRDVRAVEPSLSAEAKRALRESVGRVLAESGDPAASETLLKRRLEEDLRAIVSLVTETGARPVLLTYPSARGLGDVLAGLRDVAAESNIPLVDLEPVFGDLLKHDPREQYFNPDDHCKDAGYRIMAERVARALLLLDAPHP